MADPKSYLAAVQQRADARRASGGLLTRAALDTERLVAALTAALDLHVAVPAVLGFRSRGCRYCEVPYPCPTVRVITDALTPKENDS